MRPIGRGLAWGVSAICLLALGAAAGRTVLGEVAPGPSPSPAPALYEVPVGSVGSSVDLRARLSWATTGTVFSPGGGTVTAVDTAPRRLAEGDTVLRLDEAPMVAVGSDVPFYRSLGPGDSGRDVAALNRFLAGRGLGADAASSVFSAATAAAVRRWHAALGTAAGPSVGAGEILGIPSGALDNSLFAAVAGVGPGAVVGRGQPLLQRISDTPVWTVPLGTSVPTGLAVGSRGTATLPGGEAALVVDALATGADGLAVASLRGDAGPPCRAQACPSPAGDEHEALLPVSFVLVPSKTGPVVPVSAIETDAAGSAFVVMADGRRQRVTVLAVARGRAVVDGIAPGAVIELP